MDRWRYVAKGEIGHVWHDTVYDRYVVSDELGPAGVIAHTQRGVKTGTNARQFNDSEMQLPI